jgi:hypothetical protein
MFERQKNCLFNKGEISGEEGWMFEMRGSLAYLRDHTMKFLSCYEVVLNSILTDITLSLSTTNSSPGIESLK